MRGFAKVYAFTLKRQTERKGYRAALIIVALCCFLLPALLVYFIGKPSTPKEQEMPSVSPITTVYAVNLTDRELKDVSFMEQKDDELFGHVRFKMAASLEEALQTAGAEKTALVMTIEESSREYRVALVRPEGTELTAEDASLLGYYVSDFDPQLVQMLSGVSILDLNAAQVTVETEVHLPGEGTAPEGQGGEGGEAVPGAPAEPENQAAEEYEGMKSILHMAVVYVNVMILYFLVLFFGQGVATNILLEKQNKLVDTFLISVKPETILFGKVLASVTAAILQVLSWVASLFLGAFAGIRILAATYPGAEAPILAFLRAARDLGGMLTVPGVVLAVLVILAGFLLYCSLASIGGALASTTEDLGTTNVFFTMALVISFLAVLMTALRGGSGTPAILYWIPFTSVLITPAGLLLGEISPLMGVGILAAILAGVAVVLWIAAKCYKALILYRGKTPKPADLFKLIKGNHTA